MIFGASQGAEGASIVVSSIERSFEASVDPDTPCLMISTKWLRKSRLAAVGPLARRVAPGAGLGIAAGILYAAGDVANKAAYGGRYWLWPVLCAFHLVALIGLQLGFQRGGALATAGSANLLLNALPIVAGVTLYHEGIPAGVLGGARIAAFTFVIAGAVLLARSEPSAEPELAQAGETT